MTDALSLAAYEAHETSGCVSGFSPAAKGASLEEITELHNSAYGPVEIPTKQTNSGITSLHIASGKIVAITLYYDGILTITTGKIINGDKYVTICSYSPDRKDMMITKKGLGDAIFAYQTPINFIREFLE